MYVYTYIYIYVCVKEHKENVYICVCLYMCVCVCFAWHQVDYVSWTSRLDLRHLPLLAARIAEGGGGISSSAEAGISSGRAGE